jgi:prevent-host-death family protein
MSQHSVADASGLLPRLIDRALAGEDVRITRDGKPVVALVPVRPSDSDKPPVTAAALDWLASRRVGYGKAAQDAGALVSQMRDSGTDW